MHPLLEKSYSGRQRLVALGLLVLAVIGLPFLLRLASGQPVLIGEEAYAVLHAAAHPFSYGPESSAPNPVLPLLWVFEKAGPLGIIFLQLFLAFLSAWSLARILDFYAIKGRAHNLIMLFVLLSPAFIYAFTNLSYMGIALCFLLMSISLSLDAAEKSHAYRFLSAFITFIACLFSIANAAIVLIAHAGIAFSKRKRSRRRLSKNELRHQMLLLSAAVGALAWLLIAWKVSGAELLVHLVSEGANSLFISDMGAIRGIGVFAMLLFVFGAFATWERRGQHAYMYAIGIVLLAASVLLDAGFIIFISIPISYFAAYGFEEILRSAWQVELVKSLTILLVVCGILFSTLSYQTRLAGAFPSKDTIDAASTLSGTILSEPRMASVIRYQGNTPLVGIRSDKGQSAAIAAVYAETKLESLSNKLSALHVDGIIITKDMRESIWHGEERGMYFLLRNEERFKKTYASDDARAYQVIASRPASAP